MHALVLVCALTAPAQSPRGEIIEGRANYRLELEYRLEIRPRLRRVEPEPRYEAVAPPRMPYAGNGNGTRLEYNRTPNGTSLRYDNYRGAPRNGNGGCCGPNCPPPQPRVYGGYGGPPPPGVRESYSRGPG